VRVLIAASEGSPFSKTGGLGEVIGSLHRELLGLGINSTLITPLYKGIKERFNLSDTKISIPINIGDRIYRAGVFSLKKENSLFIDCPYFFERDELYGTSEGGYPDNAERFIFFSRAILEAISSLDIYPDIIHINDWQTALIPAYTKTIYRERFGSTPTLLTIHNLGYQGIFPEYAYKLSALPYELFTPKGIEYYGNMNFLKAGIVYSTAISTVSPTYAKEILTPEYGFGLDGVLRDRKDTLTGILNAIDTELWNPAKDKFIAKNYIKKDISGKALCKDSLAKECRFDRKNPILSMVGRLSSQKGIDIFAKASEEIIKEGINIIVLGKGDSEYEEILKGLANKYKKSFSLRLGFDEAFAHRVYAGSDIVVVPSRYEPCGLAQMIAMRYGSVPVARRTGGLSDTITDYMHLRERGNGFMFLDYSPDALLNAIKRAICVYREPKKWNKIIVSAMRCDFSWSESAKKYISLYKTLIKRIRR